MNNPEGPERAPAAPPHDPWSDRPDDVRAWTGRPVPGDRREQLYAADAPARERAWDGWEPEPVPAGSPVPPARAAGRRTAAPAGAGADGTGGSVAESAPDDDVYFAVHAAPEFQRVRGWYLRFVVPAALAFLAWYLSYVVAATVAPELMGRRVVGPVNVALLTGVGQFATTFVLIWAYARHTRPRRDPAALDLRWDMAMRTRRSDGYVGCRSALRREPRW